MEALAPRLELGKVQRQLFPNSPGCSGATWNIQMTTGHVPPKEHCSMKAMLKQIL